MAGTAAAASSGGRCSAPRTQGRDVQPNERRFLCVGESLHGRGRVLAEGFSVVPHARRAPGRREVVDRADSDPGRGPTGTCAGCRARRRARASPSALRDDGVYCRLAERWNGKKWSVENAPEPAGRHGRLPLGRSPAPPRAPAPPLGRLPRRHRDTLVERWNGKKWSVEPTPNPSGATLSFLSGVSCTSATCVWRSGFTNGSDAQATSAERWNGKKWSIEQTPNPVGAAEYASSPVSPAPRPQNARPSVITRRTNNASRTLAERWNGKKWSIQKTQNPTSNPNKTLLGVSCTSAKSCTAAGDDVRAATFGTRRLQSTGTAASGPFRPVLTLGPIASSKVCHAARPARAPLSAGTRPAAVPKRR